MGVEKFYLFGEDKKTLIKFKNTLVNGGSIYLGCVKKIGSILKVIEGYSPDLFVVEVGDKFKELKPILKVIDEKALAACVLIFDTKTEELMNFLRQSKVISYITKPVSDDLIMQVAENSSLNFNLVLRYEKKFEELNETLESRKTIEKAKWILVEQEGLTEVEAYERIRKKSRANRLPMIKIAEAIILSKKIN